MPQRNVLICPGPSSLDGQSVAAGSAGAGTPATNLLTRPLTQLWRPPSLGVGATGIGASQFLGSAPPAVPLLRQALRTWVGGVTAAGAALAGWFFGNLAVNFAGIQNTAPAFRIFRLRQVASASSSTAVYQMANCQGGVLAGLTNLPNSPGNLTADPFSAGATWLAATTPTSPIAARFQFGNQPTAAGSAALLTGSSKQVFFLIVRQSSATATNIAVDLYEGGVSKGNLLASTALPGNQLPVVICLPWDAASLASATSTTIECHVTTTGGGCDFAAVLMYPEHAPAVYLYDSGYFSLVTVPNSVYQNIYLAPLNAPVVPANALSPSWMLEMWTDWPTAAFTNYAPQCGRAFAAPGIQPVINADYGWKITVVDPSQMQRAIGGQKWAYVLPKWRTSEATFSELSESEMTTLMNAVDMGIGLTGEVLAIPQPDTPSYYPYESIFGSMLDLTEYALVSFSAWSRSLKFEESL